MDELLTRTYHLGTKPTDGRGYDDRLTMRTGFGQSRLREALRKPTNRGGLRHLLNGKKYVVTETAVREWMSDPIPKQAA